MTIKTNIWSFVAAVLCIILAFIAGAGHVTPVIIKTIGVNPWFVVLSGSSITLVFGIIGFAGGANFVSRFRSVLTAIITFGLAIFSAYVVVMANIFQFT
ncbi:hypothetical protein [Alicyclobacillus fastidiosus]|uniref:Uncharacterized protein n=1 Tax=Alicyclobacillus fastidiosus TaxID=392011 RepID=A0ABV5A941_9BACL|nr:hypothetical protein [Alicyclobacillus fastidiosus]WEH10674.1 hypothetical protein PYS47_05470 [Alicyclobacillus fastidiosus]